MKEEKSESIKSRKAADIASVITVAFLSGMFIVDTLLGDTDVINYLFVGPIMATAFFLVIFTIKNSVNHYKMAFTIPLVLMCFYTILMEITGWYSHYYLLVCLVFSAISCLYFDSNRTLKFIIVQTILIGVLLARGTPVSGYGAPAYILLINWLIYLFTSIVMLVFTMMQENAREQQHSFNDLMESTENYVAMINERNEVLFANKTMSFLANSKEPSLIQGRPFIDLFPGKSLKLYAGELLMDKSSYTGNWEFMLNGQKRYFRAVSKSLQRGSTGSLINLYDMTHLAERDEIVALKDSMKIGLFFMDKNYVIQDHYSRYLEEMLSETNLFGKLFTDLISDSVTASELQSIKDYFAMVMERAYDQEMLDDINPLGELHYVNSRTNERKVFQCAFSTIERDRGEVFILVTVYDITIRVELEQRLAEEEALRQEEMQSIFELIQVDPNVFSDFMEDVEYEFDSMDKIFKDGAISAHNVLIKVYQSVHAIKSNAVILGLNIFGHKLHGLESKIKKMREAEKEIPLSERINLAMEVEKIFTEKERFKNIIDKIQSYGGGVDKNQNLKIMVESITKAAERTAEDLEKKVRFVVDDVDHDAVEKGPRRIMKEILLQLVRNSVVHGIEMPDIRQAKGKNETGSIKLSIKMAEDNKKIQIKLNDDGSGLDFQEIAHRALQNKLIKEEDADNKNILKKVIFSPGFSTAATEGIHGGRGIGLNLVRDRIKEVNGSIKLRTEADKGTLFIVSIPVD
ncbi:MAG: ATP-binding protein [Treponema sp.]|nr:ATP-binding protein [Treponema sp.]